MSTGPAVRAALLGAVLLWPCAAPAGADDTAAAIRYVLSFPEPHHRWMQVEVTVADAGEAPLELRMSRSSPGRYALHEFAKNVWDVTAVDGAGRRLPVVQSTPHAWTVARHDGTVTLRYRVYGDRVDGTYLSVDATHAHMNIPATLMFVPGMEHRPARVTLRQPPGRRWTVATQLFATANPLEFTAPNLAYLADSPIEFGEVVLHEFSVAGAAGAPQKIRVALHHLDGDAPVREYLDGVRRIVLESLAMFGELPAFEPGHYTFIADYLPWARGDGMEHRNSTVLTSAAGMAQGSPWLLSTVAHEFLHAWNVERIRPASLEPFDYDETNLSGELWFAEGVTSYLESLVVLRAGLASREAALDRWASLVSAVTASPATSLRSPVEMSRFAAFVDGASSLDRTNHANAFLSYYTHGAAVGLALDLSLRGRSGGAVSLDDYMRALWARFGAPPPPAPGQVARPYTARDLRDVLAEVAGSRAFADEFFDRHVDGRAGFDWPALFAPAGIQVLPTQAGGATLGDLSLDFAGGRAVVSSPAPFGSPAYEAGLAQDDVLEEVDGQRVSQPGAVSAALADRRPGDEVTVRFTRRHGEPVTARVRLAAAAAVRLVPAEHAGGRASDEQRAFRTSWWDGR